MKIPAGSRNVISPLLKPGGYSRPMNHHYVYLLLDPRTDGIFYVGQGIGTRAADHMEEARQWDTAGRPPLEATTHKSPEERRAKLLRILDIAATDPALSPQVEFLRTDLSQTEADLVETVAIDLLGLDSLTNQVHGPAGTRRMRAPLYEKLAAAEHKVLHRPAIVVPTAGVRGNVDHHGGMLEADPETALENAEALWKVNPSLRSLLRERGKTPQPVLLIGLQAGPSLPKAKGIAVGIWEIEDCIRDGVKLEFVRNKTTGDIEEREVPGYKFVVATDPSDELIKLREELMWNRLLDANGKKVQANVGAIGINKQW
ncbi:hypothetical protein ANMWB30_23410 [Arthrobacter sp. MWB30]|nr:hypothetical protein ANMWB30_23410 [Arthrobacter sp. MWB30]